MMQVLYRRPDGSLRVGELAEQQLTGSSLKGYIASEEGVTKEAVHLQCQGRPVADDVEILFDACGCLEVETTYALCGGAKGKKKKKQYTTPKHVPHKRKKVKLAVLKYYSIDGEEVVRTRMFCASKTCGRGVMMAAHHDRCHCGKCGLTLLKKNN